MANAGVEAELWVGKALLVDAPANSHIEVWLLYRCAVDWSKCPDVERTAGKVSGQWVVVGTRILADGVIDNAEDGYTAEQIADEIFLGLPVDRARRIIAYARAQEARIADFA